MAKKVTIVLFLFFIGALNSYDTLQSQNIFERYWNTLVRDTADVSKPQLLVYPVVAFSPETSWELGFSSLYVYYANNDINNRLSEINAFTFLTLKDQYGLWFDHAIYSDKDKWFFLGRIRYQSFPLFYHGIGPDTPADYLARVEANQLVIKERVLKKVVKNVYSLNSLFLATMMLGVVILISLLYTQILGTIVLWVKIMFLPLNFSVSSILVMYPSIN